MLLCFYVLGRHYHSLGRQDFAALLFYRTIEGCLARRLEQRYPGLDTDRLDLSLLGDKDQVKQGYVDLTRRMGDESASLSKRLALMSSAILLGSLGDELAVRCGLADAAGLLELRDLTRTRNKSVLAHGFETVATSDTLALERSASGLLRAYWALHGDGNDLDQLCAQLRFLRTDR